jgi:hypothetical protein
MENRKFRDNEGAIHWLVQGEPLEGWTEIFEDPNQMPDPNYVMPYGARRMNAYPSFADQLDMLWHELNTSGSVSTDGTWFNTIKTVKDDNPKS